MKYTLLFLLALPTLSFAFFCPTNFNQIDYGMTKEQVVTQCGVATKEETTEEEVAVPQEWNYFLQQPPANYMGTNLAGDTQGNLKTQIVLDASGKVVNINVNGIGVSATEICGGTKIQLNMTKDQIKAACGDPAYVTKSAPTGNTPAKPNKITTLYYSNSNPPAKLVFENGVLKSRG